MSLQLHPCYGHHTATLLAVAVFTVRARRARGVGSEWVCRGSLQKVTFGLSFGLLFELRPFFSLRTPRSTLGKGRVGDPV